MLKKRWQKISRYHRAQPRVRRKKKPNFPYWHPGWLNEKLRYWEPLGIALAILGLAITSWQVFSDKQDQAQQRIVNAWQLITTQATGNSGKKEAIEFLFDQGVELNGLELSCPPIAVDTDGNCSRPVFLRGLTLDGSSYRGVRWQSAYDFFIKRYDDDNYIGTIDVQDYRFIFDKTLDQVNFEYADLSGASIKAMSLYKTNFSKAILKDATFNELIMDQVTFSDSIADATMDRVVLLRATNKSGTDRDFSGARITNSFIFDTNFSRTKFFDFKLHDSVVSQGLMMFNDFTWSQLLNTEFNGTTFRGSSFVDTDLTGSSFERIALDDVTFKRVNLTGVNFERAFLRNASFIQVWSWDDNLPKGLPNEVDLTICSAEFKEEGTQINTLFPRFC